MQAVTESNSFFLNLHAAGMFQIALLLLRYCSIIVWLMHIVALILPCYRIIIVLLLNKGLLITVNIEYNILKTICYVILECKNVKTL